MADELINNPTKTQTTLGMVIEHLEKYISFKTSVYCGGWQFTIERNMNLKNPEKNGFDFQVENNIFSSPEFKESHKTTKVKLSHSGSKTPREALELILKSLQETEYEREKEIFNIEEFIIEDLKDTDNLIEERIKCLMWEI